jgi:hypothetical protein
MAGGVLPHGDPRWRRKNTSTAAKFRCGKGGEVVLERFSGWRGSLPGGCSGVEGAMAAAHSEPISPEQNKRSGGGPVLGKLGRREEKGNGMGVLGPCHGSGEVAAAEPQVGAWTGAEPHGARGKGQKRGG